MKIENIIRRVLREQQEEKRTTGIVDFDGFVNAFYDIEIRHERTYRAVLVDLIAHPKKNNPYKRDVVFYSSWEPHRNGFKNYDTNSAYTDVGIFRIGSMNKRFNEWAYEESKKYVSKLDRYED
jgi:hypothetical protein